MEFETINEDNYKAAKEIIDIWYFEVNPDPESDLGKKLSKLIQQVKEYEKTL